MTTHVESLRVDMLDYAAAQARTTHQAVNIVDDTMRLTFVVMPSGRISVVQVVTP